MAFLGQRHSCSEHLLELPKLLPNWRGKKLFVPKPTVAAPEQKGIQVLRGSVGLLTLHEMVTNVNFSSKQLQQFSQVYLNSLFQLTMNIARVRELREGLWLSKQKDAGRVYIIVSCVSRDNNVILSNPVRMRRTHSTSVK